MEVVYSNENLSWKPIILKEDVSRHELFWSSTSFHWWIFPSTFAAFRIEVSSLAIMWVVVQKQRLVRSHFGLFCGYWAILTDIEPPNLPYNFNFIGYMETQKVVKGGFYEYHGYYIFYNLIRYLPPGKIRWILTNIWQEFRILNVHRRHHIQFLHLEFFQLKKFS